ncbi:MAG: hypothetical protein V7643_3188, partial [Mycobacterium sp.]
MSLQPLDLRARELPNAIALGDDTESLSWSKRPRSSSAGARNWPGSRRRPRETSARPACTPCTTPFPAAAP